MSRTLHRPRRRVKQDVKSVEKNVDNGKSAFHKRKERTAKKKPTATITMIKRARSKLLAASQRGRGHDLKRLFFNADRDKDSALSFSEWELCLSKHRSSVQFSLQDLKCLFEYTNTSKSGFIDWGEFIKFVYPDKIASNLAIEDDRTNNKVSTTPNDNSATLEKNSEKLTVTTRYSPPPPGPPVSPPVDTETVNENHHESKIEDELKRLDRRLQKLSASNRKQNNNSGKIKNYSNGIIDHRRRKSSKNGLLQNPYRFPRKNTLLVTKQGKQIQSVNSNDMIEKKETNNSDIPSSTLLQSVLALPEDEILKNSTDNFDDLLGRARQLSGKTAAVANAKANQSNDNDVKDEATISGDESSMNARQRNLLLLTLSSPSNNNSNQNNGDSSKDKEAFPPHSLESLPVGFVEASNNFEHADNDRNALDGNNDIDVVGESLGIALENSKQHEQPNEKQQQITIVNDTNTFRENTVVSQVEYFKQQVLQRDKYIIELQSEKKVLMDRITQYRLEISKLQSTSPHPVGYLPGRSAMVGFTGRKGNVVENIKNVQQLEVELAHSSSEIEALRAEVKRLHILENEFDTKIRFVVNNVRQEVHEEMERLKNQVDHLNKLLKQKDVKLQQEKVLHRRNVEKITKSYKNIETKNQKNDRSQQRKESVTRPISQSENAE